MHYVYILKSQKDSSFYIGMTEDLKQRLTEHNQHCSTYSASKAPFDIAWYSAFTTKRLALNFEKYLKTLLGLLFAINI